MDEALAGVTEGRVVHFVMTDGTHRAAMIVRAWGTPDGSVNLHVYLDGMNDEHLLYGTSYHLVRAASLVAGTGVPLIVWETSVRYDPGGTSPRTWHWPERA